MALTREAAVRMNVNQCNGELLEIKMVGILVNNISGKSRMNPKFLFWEISRMMLSLTKIGHKWNGFEVSYDGFHFQCFDLEVCMRPLSEDGSFTDKEVGLKLRRKIWTQKIYTLENHGTVDGD